MVMEKRYFRLTKRSDSFYTLTEMEKGRFFGWYKKNGGNSYFRMHSGVEEFLKIVNGELV